MKILILIVSLFISSTSFASSITPPAGIQVFDFNNGWSPTVKQSGQIELSGRATNASEVKERVRKREVLRYISMYDGGMVALHFESGKFFLVQFRTTEESNKAIQFIIKKGADIGLYYDSRDPNTYGSMSKADANNLFVIDRKTSSMRAMADVIQNYEEPRDIVRQKLIERIRFLEDELAKARELQRRFGEN